VRSATDNARAPRLYRRDASHYQLVAVQVNDIDSSHYECTVDALHLARGKPSSIISGDASMGPCKRGWQCAGQAGVRRLGCEAWRGGEARIEIEIGDGL